MGEEGRGQIIRRLCTLERGAEFIPRKVTGGLKKGSNIISILFLKNHSGCCGENGLSGASTQFFMID